MFIELAHQQVAALHLAGRRQRHCMVIQTNLVERNLCLNKSTKNVTFCFFPTQEVDENYRADTETAFLGGMIQ